MRGGCWRSDWGFFPVSASSINGSGNRKRDRFPLGQFDVLALTGCVTMPKSRQNPGNGEQGHGGIGVEHPRRHRHVGFVAGDRGKSDEALLLRPKGDEPTVRTGSPKRGHRDHHQVRFDAPELLVVDAQPLRHADAEVLDNHVGHSDKRLEDFDTLYSLQVDSDVAFVAVVFDESPRPVIRLITRVRRSDIRPRIWSSGPSARARDRDESALSHLDHVGAKIAEDGGSNTGRTRPGKGRLREFRRVVPCVYTTFFSTSLSNSSVPTPSSSTNTLRVCSPNTGAGLFDQSIRCAR